MSNRNKIACLAVILTMASLAAPAAAEWDFGARAGVYTDISEPFVGIEGLTQIGRTDWWFNPNLEAVLVSDGSLLTLNGDVHYDVDLDAPVFLWIGGGPAVIFRDPPGRPSSETDLGLNLLAGVGWKGLPVVPYVQGKVVVSDDTEVVAAVGVRF